MSSPYDRIMQDFAKRLESAAESADTRSGAPGNPTGGSALFPLTVERVRELQARADQAFRDFHGGLPRPTSKASPSLLSRPLTMERLRELQADLPWQIEDFRAANGLPSLTSTDEPWRTAVAPAPLPTNATPRRPLMDAWRTLPPISAEPTTQAVSQQAGSVQIREVEAAATGYTNTQRTPEDDACPQGEDDGQAPEQHEEQG